MDCEGGHGAIEWSGFVGANIWGYAGESDYLVNMEKFKTSMILENLYV